MKIKNSLDLNRIIMLIIVVFILVMFLYGCRNAVCPMCPD